MHKHSLHSAWIIGDEPVVSSGEATALFPWWSFTKTVLAVCALRLAEDGRLALDALRPNRPYTLRQLLQHRAGVPNYGELPAYHAAVARNDPPWSRAQLLAAVGGDRLIFPPGTGWAYSNVGYMFVREAIEDASGLSLADALYALILAPIGVPSVRLATTLEDFGDVFWPELRQYDPGWVYHGCLLGTPVAAAKVLHAVLGGSILQPETRLMMLEQLDLGGAIPGRPWTQIGYSLGLMSGRMREAGKAIGHSGAGPFCVNAVYHFPELADPITVATFTDGEDEGVAESEAASIACRARS